MTLSTDINIKVIVHCFKKNKKNKIIIIMGENSLLADIFLTKGIHIEKKNCIYTHYTNKTINRIKI